MKFAEVIGDFNFKLILGLLYFGMFTPVGMVASLFREDPLTQKIEPLGFVHIFQFKGYFHGKNT